MRTHRAGALAVTESQRCPRPPRYETGAVNRYAVRARMRTLALAGVAAPLPALWGCRQRRTGQALLARLCELRPFGTPSTSHWDGCCNHRAIPADEELHRHAAENLNRADALFFGRVTYEMILKVVSRLEYDSGAVAMRYEPRR